MKETLFRELYAAEAKLFELLNKTLFQGLRDKLRVYRDGIEFGAQDIANRLGPNSDDATANAIRYRPDLIFQATGAAGPIFWRVEMKVRRIPKYVSAGYGNHPDYGRDNYGQFEAAAWRNLRRLYRDGQKVLILYWTPNSARPLLLNPPYSADNFDQGFRQELPAKVVKNEALEGSGDAYVNPVLDATPKDAETPKRWLSIYDWLEATNIADPILSQRLLSPETLRDWATNVSELKLRYAKDDDRYDDPEKVAGYNWEPEFLPPPAQVELLSNSAPGSRPAPATAEIDRGR